MEEYDIVSYKYGICYYKKGTFTLHRLDGPAFEHIEGHCTWYLDGKKHRVGGPADQHSDGSLCWYINDQLHREDGPAIISPRNGYKGWYINGKRHRLDGPAAEYSDGLRTNKWYIDGIRLSTEKEAIMNLWYENGRI